MPATRAPHKDVVCEPFHLPQFVWVALLGALVLVGCKSCALSLGHVVTKYNVRQGFEEFRDFSSQLCRDAKGSIEPVTNTIYVDGRFIGTMPVLSFDEGCVVTPQIKAQFKLVEDLTTRAIDFSSGTLPEVLLATHVGNKDNEQSLGAASLSSWLKKMSLVFYGRVRTSVGIDYIPTASLAPKRTPDVVAFASAEP